MTGLDTNVLVRYIMQDDRRQSPVATRCVESLSGQSPGFVPLVAMVELCWVLESAYALEREQLVVAIEGLLRAKELVIEHAAEVWRAVRAFESAGADFADALISASSRAAGAARTVTFDRLAARDSGMELLN